MKEFIIKNLSSLFSAKKSAEPDIAAVTRRVDAQIGRAVTRLSER